jgi:hypothetical protein
LAAVVLVVQQQIQRRGVEMVLRHRFLDHFRHLVQVAVVAAHTTTRPVTAAVQAAVELVIREVGELVRLEKEVLEELAQTQAPVGELVVAVKLRSGQTATHQVHPEMEALVLNG